MIATCLPINTSNGFHLYNEKHHYKISFCFEYLGSHVSIMHWDVYYPTDSNTEQFTTNLAGVFTACAELCTGEYNYQQAIELLNNKLENK